MKLIAPLKAFVIFLLLLNGTGAVFGGSQLMMHPDGSTMDLPLSLLSHSVFNNYLVPGVILFFANGLSSFFVISTVVFSTRHYPIFVIGQGIVLCIWILAQVLLINMVNQLHVMLGCAGMLLLICGWALRRLNAARQVPSHSHS